VKSDDSSIPPTFVLVARSARGSDLGPRLALGSVWIVDHAASGVKHHGRALGRAVGAKAAGFVEKVRASLLSRFFAHNPKSYLPSVVPKEILALDSQ
jgi:hypothetical protein